MSNYVPIIVLEVDESAVDPLSGNAVLNGVPVSVEVVAPVPA